MMMESRQKCLGIIGLLVITVLGISVSVPAKLTQETYSGKLAGNTGFKTGVAEQDSRIIREQDNVAVTDANTSYINPDTDEALYNDNIQIWILIVLIVLGSYILIVGLVTYTFIRRVSSGIKSNSKKPHGMEGYSD